MQTKFKGIKKTAKIFGLSVAGIIIFLALLFVLLQTSMSQQFFSKIIVSELSEKLHTKVQLGKIDYKFFNTIAIQDLYVEDLQKDTLLFVKQANAHFKFWKFFEGKIIFKSIDIDQLDGNLVIDKAGHSNLDFILEAFKSPPKKDSTQVTYRITHFIIRNSRFAYSNLKEFQKLPDGVFNGNKLRFRNINTDITLNILKKDSINAQIHHFSAEEQSGLILTDFQTKLIASARGVKIPSIDLKMPHSNLLLENVQLKYDSLADLQHFANKVRWNAPIKLSTIAFSDFSAFIPEFKGVKGKATLEGLITGRISGMRFEKMKIKYGNSFELNADLDVNGLPNLSEAFVYGQIKDLHLEKGDLQDFISDITRKPFILPKELNQLGMIHYQGNITGFLNNLVLYGNLNSNVGSITTDISLKFANQLKDLAYNGTIKSNSFKLGALMDNKQLGETSFSFNTIGTKKENAQLQGTIQAKIAEFQFNNYTYRDIEFGGKYDGKGFNGTADFKDENIDAHFDGKIDLTQKLPVFDFDLVMNNINLNALKLTDKYKDAKLSFSAKTNMVGNSLDNINGFLSIKDIQFTNQNKTLNVDEIRIVSRIVPEETRISVNSDYLNGSLSGNFKYSTVGQSIDRIVQNYLPALGVREKIEACKTPNHIDIDLKISNTKDISDVLVLPYSLRGESTFKGYIDEKTNKIDLSGNIPLLISSKDRIENIALYIDNSNKQLQLNTRAQIQSKDEIMNVFLKASAAKDTLKTQLGWQNTQQITNAGEIETVTRFKIEKDNVVAQLNIKPTQVIISDSTWNIHPCRIDFNADSTIQIRNFSLENHNQYVHINGLASKNINDGVSVSMNELDLDFVMELLKLRGISLSGIVTGKATLLRALEDPVFEANLKVKGFKLNHKTVGDGTIYSTWDKPNSRLLANGYFVNKNDTVVKANGVYTPKTDTIDIHYNAHNFSIEFLSQYFESVAQNVGGLASGKIRMYGPLKHGVSFEGDAYVRKGQATIKTLKTTYYLEDSVHLTRNTIELRNTKVYDQEGNPANLTAILNHNGFFQHMKFNVNIAGKNILALNTKAEDNDYFFGKAYANGTVHIFGDENEANIMVNAVSQPQTKCYIQMGGASKASDNSFINFVDKRQVYSKKDSIAKHKPAGTEMNVKVNLQIEVNPNADMELIVDPKGGDRITGKGNANLRIEFDTFSDIKLYGTYTINSGYYLFTLQNLIRKEFKIDQGSTLAWTGNPYNAQSNIRALYPLTASLKDLDETLTSTSTRTTVPVNCVLKLTDNIMKPTIKFDIDLPQSDEGVKQLVRNIVNTDEMMNRQILYLLVFNKFYTPDYMKTAQTANVGTTEGISFLTSTASAQINNWITQMIKSNNFSVGFDVKTNDFQNTDFQAQFLYQPNNRWIVNGNIGYRNDNLSTTTNRFIGDVDIQYLLTESGKLRFKAYNHSIDRYQLVATTQVQQGLGFIYKEDFNSVGELFSYYWHLLLGNKNKNTNEEQPTIQK